MSEAANKMRVLMPEWFGGNGAQEPCEASFGAGTMHVPGTAFPAIPPRAVDPVGTSSQMVTALDVNSNGPKDTQPSSAP